MSSCGNEVEKLLTGLSSVNMLRRIADLKEHICAILFSPYVDNEIIGIIPCPEKLLIMPFVKLDAVVGALGTTGLKPVRVPPVDTVDDVHQAGVPVLLFAKNMAGETCDDVTP
jgi:hypothetical protein